MNTTMQFSSVRRVPPTAAFRRLLAALLLPLGAALLPLHLSAQTPTSVIPNLISYQGRVSDSSGAFVGASAPVNRTVTFRIWNHPSDSAATNLIYAERQTVTISQGEFSVLIGQGTELTTNDPKGPPATTIGSPGVFSGALRYLGVTVDDGTAAADTEISPRQQMVSAAYSLRSKYAEFLGANGASTLTALDNGNIGIGTTSPTQPLHISGNSLTTGTAYLLDANHSIRAISSSGVALSTFGVTDGLILKQTTGNVGIGTSSPATKLEVTGGIRANGASGFTFESETDGGLYSPADGTITIRTNGTERLRVTSSGDVGVGTTSPGVRLDVAGQARVTTDAPGGFAIKGSASNTNPAEIVFDKSVANPSPNPTNINHVGAAGYATDRGLFFWVNGSDRMNVSKDGNVGIGITSPSAPLHVKTTGGDLATFEGTTAGSYSMVGLKGTGRQYKIGVGNTGEAAHSVASKFFVYDNNAGAMRMAIDSSGNFGIGTTSPGQKLDVNGTARANGISVGDSGYAQSSVGAFNIDAANVAGGRMTVTTLGNVGIGTTSPAAKLDVAGTAVMTGLTVNGNAKISSAGTFSIDSSATFPILNVGTKGTSNGTAGTSAANISGGRFFISTDGKIGIGTNTPETSLHIVNRGVKLGNFARGARMENDNTGDTNSDLDASSGTVNWDGGRFTGLLVDARVRATAIDVTTISIDSDRRIKRIVGRSSAAKDLETLLRLQITDYDYKDPTLHGTKPQKKLIAQEVEEVFPQAVSRKVGLTPDIYQFADQKDGWIALSTDLKIGDRVRLVGDIGGMTMYEVLEMQSGRFRVDYKQPDEKVFVYGREVRDFRALDYEAVSMLNVSATQEIKREKDAEVKALREQNTALTAEVAALRSQVSALAAQEKTRDAKLASIEKLLQSSQTVMAQPAKAATANGQE
jgi:hypothetical protein